jgi:hypothetical protein
MGIDFPRWASALDATLLAALGVAAYVKKTLNGIGTWVRIPLNLDWR